MTVRSGLARAGAMIFLASVLLMQWGCLGGLGPAPNLPEKALFQEGDILVSFTGGVESWFFILGLWPERADSASAFSHAEMVFRSPSGGLMLGGVSDGRLMAVPLKSGLGKTLHFVLFRSQAPFAQRQKAGRIMTEMVYSSGASETGFDWSLTYRPGRPDRVFCAGVINEAYRLAGLNLPFASVAWHHNPLTRHLEEILKVRFTTTLSVDSIFRAKGFSPLVTWENPRISLETVEVRREIVLYLVWAYDQGMRLKPAPGPDPATVPDGGIEFLRFRTSFQKFCSKVLGRWQRDIRHGRLEGKTDGFKKQWVKDICDAYRDDFFHCPPDHDKSFAGLRP